MAEEASQKTLKERLKQRMIQEAVIDLDDIKQYVTEDGGVTIEIDKEKYLVPIKDLFKLVMRQKRTWVKEQN